MDDQEKQQPSEATPEEENKTDAPETPEAEPETPVNPPEDAAEETAQETAGEEKKGTSPTAGKIALSIAFVVVMLGALIALVVAGATEKRPTQTEGTVPTQTQSAATEDTAEPLLTEPTEAPTIPEDGNPDDVTCKGTYTASDEDVIAARDTVVATAGDRELTLGELQVYYWMEVRSFLNSYGYYLSYFGLDYTQDLDTQLCSAVENRTWQQYFLESALQSWQNYVAMASESLKNGVQMDASYRAEVDDIANAMNESAITAGFADGDALIHGTLGAAANMEDYSKFMEVYYQGLSYYEHVTGGFTAEPEEIENFFREHQAEYEENGLSEDTMVVDVRHILVFPEGATSDTIRTDTFSDEAWASGEAKAKDLLSQWEAGDRTEESFAELANTYSEDGGSNTNGGLYEGVEQGQMVTEFNDWCFDQARQAGDVDIVKTSLGYHIMYFCGSRYAWEDAAGSDLITEKINSFVEEVSGQYPLTVDYSKILLAYVNLAEA